MTTFDREATWDDTPQDHGEVSQVCRSVSAVISCEGVEFKSFLPGSRADADRINAAARSLTDGQGVLSFP